MEGGYSQDILKESEKNHKPRQYRYKKLFEEHSSIMLIIDPQNGSIIDANKKAIRFYGYTKDKLCKKSIYDLNISNKKEIKSKMKLVEYKNESEFEFKHRISNGKVKDVKVQSVTIDFNNKNYLYSVISDITEQKKDKNRIRLLAKALENNTEGVIITDNDSRIKWINQAFTDITGYNLEEIEDKKPKIFQSGKHDKSFYRNMWSTLLDKGKWSGEVWNKNKKDELYPENLRIYSIKDAEDNITHFTAIISDISSKKQREKEMRNLIYRDTLTGLYNRFFMKNRLDSQIMISKERGKKLAILYMDIDNFKRINDNLGHSVGDEVIKEFGRRLKQHLDKESIIARIGGDEFIVLIPDILNREEVIRTAIKIKKMLKNLFSIGKNELAISCSIGICIYPKDGQDTETLIKNADIAMYEAKRSNTNKIKFYKECLQIYVKENFLIDKNLKKAIEKEEIYLKYQPIIDLQSNKIVGVESLARWNNPNIGKVSPMKFIPIAEENNQIISIGKWILTEACYKLKSWHEKGFNYLTIAVNVSIKQLEKRNFYRFVLKILNEVKLDPKYFILEITETMYISQKISVINNLKKLKDNGIKIAIDDFGTGYSSLSKLKDLEIDILKIDKSFIENVKKDKSKKEIVLAILAMASSLNFKVIGEGIETQAQCEFLYDNKCGYGQGYLFSRPKGADEIEKMLEYNLK